MNKKRILLTIILILTIKSLPAKDDWQLWIDSGIIGKFSDKISGNFLQHYRIKNDISTFAYLLMEPSIYFNYHKKGSFGFTTRPAFSKNSSNNWKYEIDTGVVFKNKYKVKNLNLESTIKALYATPAKNPNFGYLRAKLNADLISNKLTTFYAAHEIQYNSHQTANLDQHRTQIGFKGLIDKKFNYAIYYLLRLDKTSSTYHWQTTNVIGLKFVLKF